jgi:hypothetical protein
MAGQQSVIRKDDVVADLAIVGDVNARHDEIAITDDSGAVGLHRSVERGMLADGVVGPDDEQAGEFGLVEVLRQSAQDGSFVNDRIDAEPRTVFYDYVTGQLAVGTDHHITFDDGKRPDRDIQANLGFWTYDRQRMDIHGRLDPTIIGRTGNLAALCRLDSGCPLVLIGRASGSS